MSKKNILIAGGGTGGHITPALAIAETLKSEFNIIFFGNRNSLEESIYKKNSYEFHTIPVTFFKRKKIFSNLKTVFLLFISILKSIYFCIRFRPKYVIGTGGFVSFPLVFTASMLGIKTFIHEQNAYPGIANKLLARFVTKIFTSYEESEKYLSKYKEKCLITGNPIREDIINNSFENSRKCLNLDNSKKVLLIFCGSNGSKAVNEHVVEHFNLLNRENLHTIFVTGKKYYNDVISKVNESENIKIHDFLHNIDSAIHAANLIIARPGALTLAELSSAKKPSLLVPFPYSAENHQDHNALVYEENGASKVIRVKELKEKELLKTAIDLIFKDKEIKKMSDNSYKLAKLNSKQLIHDTIVIS